MTRELFGFSHEFLDREIDTDDGYKATSSRGQPIRWRGKIEPLLRQLEDTMEVGDFLILRVDERGPAGKVRIELAEDHWRNWGLVP